MWSARVVGVVAWGWLAGCGFNKAAVGDAGADVDTLSGPTDDARLCFDGFTPVCLEALPTEPRVIDANTTINTEGGCAATTMDTAIDICVIAATTIEIKANATLRVVGPRPLVLLATTSIVIAGTLDAASHRDEQIGAGATGQDCKPGTAPTAAGQPNVTGGGGYGGTFGSTGGKGGDVQDRGRGGTAAAAGDLPTTLRGGCAGVAGAHGNPGRGGAGGGAVELNAPRIEVAGMINASGAGGLGGIADDAGAGGGGSGGMIVFDTQMLAVTGAVIAQGGAGGGGSGGSGAGLPGNDPMQPGMAASAGDGFHGGGGSGGAGGVGAVGGESGAGQLGTQIGGGGGGGGTGVTKGPTTTGMIFPAFR